MKAMKLALLGTAALAAASVSARADSLADLKAQIETLNARVATLEATPAVPAGYSLVSFSKGQDLTVPGYYEGNKDVGPAHVISVVPTADAPAAASAVITWSGWVRGAVITGRNVDTTAAPGLPGSPGFQYGTDVRVRGEIVVSGKTDTAVGEVGARVALETGAGVSNVGGAANGSDAFRSFNGSNNGAFTTDGFWGWWKMTPNLTLGAGIDGSLAKNSKSFDAACTCYYEGTGGSVGLDNGNGADPAQIRLSYADGPLGFAVAVEDSNNSGDSSAVGVAAKATWAGDMFSADLSGGYWGNAAATPAFPNNAWSVDGGVGASLGSMATIMATVGVGSQFAANSDFTKASGMLKLTLADTAHAELGITHTWNTDSGMGGLDSTVVAGGLYYDPVKQLTIGAEGSYVSGGIADGSYVADLVTVFRF